MRKEGMHETRMARTCNKQRYPLCRSCERIDAAVCVGSWKQRDAVELTVPNGSAVYCETSSAAPGFACVRWGVTDVSEHSVQPLQTLRRLGSLPAIAKLAFRYRWRWMFDVGVTPKATGAGKPGYVTACLLALESGYTESRWVNGQNDRAANGVLRDRR